MSWNIIVDGVTSVQCTNSLVGRTYLCMMSQTILQQTRIAPTGASLVPRLVQQTLIASTSSVFKLQIASFSGYSLYKL